jgi:hypothetical protein
MLKTVPRVGALVLALLALPSAAHAAGSPPLLSATQWSLNAMAGFPTGARGHRHQPRWRGGHLELDLRGAVALARGGRLIGRAPFPVRAGQTATARVRVARSTASALRRHGSVPVVVTITVDGGDPGSVRRTLKLRTC